MEIKSLHFKEIGSTNTFAKESAEQFDKNALTVISADIQTKGRGRFKRTWESPFGNLFLTFVFFVSSLDENIGNLPQVLSLSALKALKLHGLEIGLKWPNDLVIQDKKLGGILVEIATFKDSFAIIAGIGINLTLSDEIKKRIDRKATSFFEEKGIIIKASDLRKTLIELFEKDLTLFKEKGFPPFYPLYTEKLIHKKDELLTISDFKKKLQGTFQGIDPKGGLILKLQDESHKCFTAGELL